jgi:hypothetical protein
MRIHSTVASPALLTSPQGSAKSSGDSFLSILSSASAEQKSGAIRPDEDPHADADARGTEADSNEQNETSSMARAHDGGIRSNGSGQHIVQKNDSAVESASTKGQSAAASSGPRAAVQGARPTGTTEQTKDASSAHAFDSSAEAPTQASIEAQASMSSFQGALASSSAAQVSPDGQAGVQVKTQFDAIADSGVSDPTKGSVVGTGSSGGAIGEAGQPVNEIGGAISSAAAAFNSMLQPAAEPGSVAEKIQPLFGSSLPPVAAPLGADGSPNFAKDPSGGADAGQASPLDSALSQQGDGSWSGFGPTEESADRADELSVATMQALVSAQPGLKSQSDLPVPNTKTMPGKQSTSAANPILSNASSGTASKSTDTVASLAATEAGIAGIEPFALPAVPALAATGSSNQLVVNGATKASSNAAGAKNTTAASTTDATSGNAIDNGSGPVDGSSHNAQTNGQPAPAAPSLTLGTVTNAADSATAHVQTQVPIAQPDSTTTASTHRTQDGSGVPSELAGQQAAGGPVHEEGSEPVATSSINTARLMQSMSESEMRVGMHSSEFGDISIRTSISQQQMVAQISLNHSDLSQAIAAHVSTVQAKLGEDYGIHASIEVHNMGSGLANDPGQSSQREQSDFRRSARTEIGLPGAEESSSIQFAAVASTSNGNRLDIRA